jgi:hypothetical protein
LEEESHKKTHPTGTQPENPSSNQPPPPFQTEKSKPTQQKTYTHCKPQLTTRLQAPTSFTTKKNLPPFQTEKRKPTLLEETNLMKGWRQMSVGRWLVANGFWAGTVNKIKKKWVFFFFFVFGFKDPVFLFLFYYVIQAILLDAANIVFCSWSLVFSFFFFFPF